MAVVFGCDRLASLDALPLSGFLVEGWGLPEVRRLTC